MDALNALVALLNFVVIPATAYGAQLALGALGVTLIYGILRFSNFAHGDTMAFGTAGAVIGTWGLQAMGVSLGPLPTALLALPLGIACAAYLASALHLAATLTVTELTGSETFVHLDHHGDRWVGLIHGMHDLTIGADLKVYLDPRHVYFFGENGDLVAPAAYALAA